MFRNLKMFKLGLVTLSTLVLVSISWFGSNPTYIYSPSKPKVKNPEQLTTVRVQANEDYSSSTLELGRKMFYEETFGNEVFFTDIMGSFDGPLTLANITKAVISLGGRGTANLQVELAESFKVGDKSFQKGELFDTGLDVAKGAYSPLGVKITFDDGRLKAGISCALCHATVDGKTGKVMQGVPNTDLNVGWMLAMGTNTASYFTHTDIKSLEDYLIDSDRTIKDSEGKIVRLPDPKILEETVDRDLVKWPRGSNDTTLDFMNNPVQIPDSFTLGDHPYGWSGQGLIGPYQGLSAAINNAHAQNTDGLSQTEISKPVLGIDKEVYLGTVLQNAATSKYRYEPSLQEKPSEFLAKIDPTPGVTGVNELIRAPFYPKISYISSVGHFQGSARYKAWEQVNAMSAWMNTNRVPKPEIEVDNQTVEIGKEVFIRAGCVTCHAGDYLTNNRIIPVKEVGTEASRARGFQLTERFFAEPSMWSKNTPVPIPDSAQSVPITITEDQRDQLKLAWAHDKTNGGYKVPSLLGLYWSVPYLHDGGVSVGKDLEKEVGASLTLHRGVQPDPFNSMRAMIDRELRRRVIQANRQAKDLAHVTGEGHSYWVDDQAGFTSREQDALIMYLFSIHDPGEKAK
ncbi:electron transport protein [Ammoniphilus sp. CFH 90114]|uniref:electron transport protein n=1 Tax=Ammoniphilus sp. CFH 90114 TaxID=2493665 RepID=UPI00100F7E62|nr:electron transport protein [Ammoniphilus sp. CFH 90114]RXT15470.1 electron transport protein [Ammoniphilus sp. CFH 90114]